MKFTAGNAPEVAVTLYEPPDAEFAVNVDEVAWPFESVVSVSTKVPVLVNVPLGPDAGAVKVTETPLTGTLLPSTTVTTSFAPNSVLTVARCGVPLEADIPAGA